MIARTKIEALIKAGEIGISYTFAPVKDRSFEYLGQEKFVKLEDPESPATKLFQQNYFNDRLTVTLGPVVMSHDYRYGRKRPPFKNYENCTDIRTSDNRIEIYPRETISVSTNERIKLKALLGGFVLPRLKLADSGLLYTASYIDPWWDGILQAVIVNATDDYQELHLGDPIATCFFFFVQGEVPENIQEEFEKKSHHYGQNWPAILEMDRNPFPRVVKPVPKEGLQTITDSVSRWWSRTTARIPPIFLNIATVLAIIGAVYWAGTTQGTLSRLEKSQDSVVHSIRGIEKEQESTVRELQHQTKGMPRSGVMSVPVQSGLTSLAKSINVLWPPDKSAEVWLQALDRPDDIAILEGRIEGPQSGGPGSQLTIELKLKRPVETKRIRVKWLVVAQ
jgi:deoxycytidine triphosphate deaminase